MRDEFKFKDALASRVVKAIRTPSLWADVLDEIIAMTPATAAIITLRDKHTCQIVNDQELERKYHSPLIRGFSFEAVAYYLTELRTIDPWAEYQRTHYPFRPTAMSRVCDPANYPDNAFYDWLFKLDMEDTIVFELDRMAGYWTALNLFMPNRNSEEIDEGLRFAETHFDFLRDSWKASQDLLHMRQSESALLNHFSEQGEPCCLVGANGEYRQGNSRFADLLSDGIVRFSGPRKKVSFAADIEIYGIEAWEDHKLARHEAAEEDWTVTAKTVEPDPLFEGKRETLWLLAFSQNRTRGQSQAVSVSQIPGMTSLTAQESRLLRLIVEGESVVNAGNLIGVKRSRAFEIWSSVKEKLGVTSAHEARVRMVG